MITNSVIGQDHVPVVLTILCGVVFIDILGLVAAIALGVLAVIASLALSEQDAMSSSAASSSLDLASWNVDEIDQVDWTWHRP